MRVDVYIREERSESELRSLQGWLGQEPAVRRTAVLTLQEKSAEPGSMGSVLDVLQLVTGNGWSAASFVLSVAAWRQTRPRAPQVTIRRGNAEISISNGTEAELRNVLEVLESAGGQGQPDGPDAGQGPRP
ncbi:effector-associated constant component EACC1 [Streptomyces sp. HUCO-GS316]|uniref:effector-associated constant component EACC1 n=1 Tax=Streptomyces sp. HUCO-GS316 TaxID=2692198 RepID=UPI00301CF02B